MQGTQHGIQALIDNSRSAYPQLQTYINTILERLRATPVKVVGYHYPSGGARAQRPRREACRYVVHVTGDKFIDYLASQLRATPYCTNLPKNIKYMFDTQRYEFIADSWISSMDFSFAATGPGRRCSGQRDVPVGVRRQRRVLRQAVGRPRQHPRARHRSVDGRTGSRTASSTGSRPWCGAWPVDPLPASVRLPVVSSIPTMMLVGTLDVATPSIFSRPSEAGLSNHVYYEIVSGHATAYLPCVLDMLDAWLQRPGVAPGNRCPQTYTWDAPESPSLLSFEALVTGAGAVRSITVGSVSDVVVAGQPTRARRR